MHDFCMEKNDVFVYRFSHTFHSSLKLNYSYHCSVQRLEEVFELRIFLFLVRAFLKEIKITKNRYYTTLGREDGKGEIKERRRGRGDEGGETWEGRLEREVGR